MKDSPFGRPSPAPLQGLLLLLLLQVAGTSRGITAVQLDTKLPGVDLHLLTAALAPAAAARQHILTAMEAAVKACESSECREPASLQASLFFSEQRVIEGALKLSCILCFTSMWSTNASGSRQ